MKRLYVELLSWRGLFVYTDNFEKFAGNFLWRGGRVVECGGLENRWALKKLRGFESLSLRVLLILNILFSMEVYTDLFFYNYLYIKLLIINYF